MILSFYRIQASLALHASALKLVSNSSHLIDSDALVHTSHLADLFVGTDKTTEVDFVEDGDSILLPESSDYDLAQLGPLALH